STAGSATTAGTASDVTFNYADSTSKGGAASSVANGSITRSSLAASNFEYFTAKATSSTEVNQVSGSQHFICTLSGISVGKLDVGTMSWCKLSGSPNSYWTLHARGNGVNDITCEATCF
ncbi:MAG: hypothetical protein JW841_11055, partial [Deltaproteobacteria bacterium]|nr:hypothetical protein [Deltaproteobacteria bacterium]